MIIPGAKLKSFIIPFLLFFALYAPKASAQSTSSPYSRYGIGDVNNKVFGQGFAMGGTSLAIQNDTIPQTFSQFFTNSNPASYTGVQYTTAELGLNYNRMRLQSSDTRKNVNNASFGYVAIAFPFKRWWAGSFGLIPYSSVGYNVIDDQEIPNVGTVDYTYEGSGGVSQAYIGTALKPFYGLPRMFIGSDNYRRLMSHRDKSREQIYEDWRKAKRILNVKKFLKTASFGANGSYLFGNIENSRTSVFSSSSTFNARTGTTTRFGDVYFDYGFQVAYTIDSVRHRNPMYNRDSARLDPRYDSVVKFRYRDLEENVQLLFGANFAAQTDISAKIDSLSVTYFHSPAGYDIVKDTVEFVEGHKGTVTLPLSFGVGIGFKKGTRWLVAADFSMQNWSSFQAFNQSQGLKNSMRVSLGAQYIPKKDAPGMKNYLKRVNYRFGGRYMQTSLELKNSQLTEYSFTFGFGFPVASNYTIRSFSMVNIGFEIGERGTVSNGLIKEQFFRTTIGFTINDRWFQKTKFD
ncbi:MAG: hypothetical protein JWO44_1017 [Bacteroidetes bacterium]|jgi:hypothetical protein|nr:hypothetical protein [Bacteroidota bacterium]